MNDLKVWIGCLADYNAGILNGRWFDLEDHWNAEGLEKAVREQVLMTSSNPNVEVDCPECEGAGFTIEGPDETQCTRCHGTGRVPSSEEWFIADSEGFPKGSVDQYTSFDTLYEIKERLDEAYDEFGDDGAEILEAFEHCFGTHNEASIKTIREAYRGEYESGKDFAYEFYADTSDKGFMEHPLINYIDWDHVWEGELEQDFCGHNGHYFWSDWS